MLKVFDENGYDGELILVNDASRDRTGELSEAAAAQGGRVRVVHHPINRGIVAGWVSGVGAARGDLIAAIDADMQYRPEDIPKMVDLYRRGGVDVVQGRREQQPERSAIRRALTAMLSWLLNLAFGTRLPDNKSGFLLAPKDVWQRMLDTRDGLKHFQHFVGIAIVALGLRIGQVPIVFDPRVAGRSYITSPIRFAARALADFPRAFWIYRVRRRRLRSQ